MMLMPHRHTLVAAHHRHEAADHPLVELPQDDQAGTRHIQLAQALPPEATFRVVEEDGIFHRLPHRIRRLQQMHARLAQQPRHPKPEFQAGHQVDLLLLDIFHAIHDLPLNLVKVAD
jgi:hypothetical protein